MELYASLQNILDVIAMLIAELGLRKPCSYPKLGEPLLESGLISQKLFYDIKLIATTRNILAHAYRKPSVKDLDKIVEEILPKAERIIKVLVEILRQKNIASPILEDKKRALIKVFKKYNVRLVYLFGSRARSDERGK